MEAGGVRMKPVQEGKVAYEDDYIQTVDAARRALVEGSPRGEELAHAALQLHEDADVLSLLGSLYLERGSKGLAMELFHRAYVCNPSRSRMARDKLADLVSPLRLADQETLGELHRMRMSEVADSWTSSLQPYENHHVVALGRGPLALELCSLALRSGAAHATAVCCSRAPVDPVTPEVLRQIVSSQSNLSARVKALHLPFSCKDTDDAIVSLRQQSLDHGSATVCLVGAAAFLEHMRPSLLSQTVRKIKQCILAPGALVLPRTVAAMVQPVSGQGLARWRGVDSSCVLGVDLGLLDDLRPPMVAIPTQEFGVVHLAAAKRISRLDLVTGSYDTACSRETDATTAPPYDDWVGSAQFVIQTAGELLGLMFWFVDELCEDNDHTFVSGTGGPGGHRHVTLLEKPIHVSVGDILVVADALFLSSPIFLTATSNAGDGGSSAALVLRSQPYLERRAACKSTAVQEALDRQYSKCWPMAYHFCMTNDLDRNMAFVQGLQAAVAETQTLATKDLEGRCYPYPFVLDVGAGSGLMSLFAANIANARNIFAIEQSKTLGQVGKSIIQRNEHTATITYLCKHSDFLVQGDCAHADLPGPAAVWVAEIFGDDPLSEGILQTIGRARQRGLIDDSTVSVPLSVSIWGQLVDSPEFLSVIAEPPSGYELLQPFAARRVPLRRYGRAMSFLSAPTCLLQVDLGPNAKRSGEACTSIVATEDGCARFVLYWYELTFPGGGVYSTFSGADPKDGRADSDHIDGGGWLHGSWNEMAFQLNETAQVVRCGQSLRMLSSFMDEKLWFALAPVASNAA